MTTVLWGLYGVGCACVGALLAAWVRAIVAGYRRVH